MPQAQRRVWDDFSNKVFALSVVRNWEGWAQLFVPELSPPELSPSQPLLFLGETLQVHQGLILINT